MSTFPTFRIVSVDANRLCISIVLLGKRYRFYNGKAIGLKLSPNLLPPQKRRTEFLRLSYEFQKAFELGWRPEVLLKSVGIKVQHPLRQALADKLQENISNVYSNQLKLVVSLIPIGVDKQGLKSETIVAQLLKQNFSPATFNNVRAHLLALETNLKKYGYTGYIANDCKKMKATQQLHKPFKNVQAVLSDIYAFDKRLHLCCLLSFGCLLRPHREIRELTWGEIASNLDQISLSGSRNKGKMNRIVPIPAYLKPYLEEFATIDVHADTNVFTGTESPYSPDFFKGLWTKYKKQSKLLEKDQTLYSFRHTGAIQVYEKTGSLTKLQQVMGHSSLQVSLTYLRGLEVKQLDPNDMPVASW